MAVKQMGTWGVVILRRIKARLKESVLRAELNASVQRYTLDDTPWDVYRYTAGGYTTYGIACKLGWVELLMPDE